MDIMIAVSIKNIANELNIDPIEVMNALEPLLEEKAHRSTVKNLNDYFEGNKTLEFI